MSAETLSWTVLGAGTAIPHPSRNPSGHFLRWRRGDASCCVLVDMGAGTLWRLARAGHDWAALDAVCLSHRHLDHTLDLQALLFASRIPGHGRRRALPVHMGPGMLAFVEGLRGALGKWMEPRGFEVQWLEHRGDEVLRVGPMELALSRVAHDETSVGMRWTSPGGKVVAYSGDSDHCQALVSLCRGADLAVLECSTDDAGKLPGHMSPREVAQVALEARLERVVLVHMYPALDGVDVAAAVAAHGFKGDVLVAHDGLCLEV